MKKRFWLAVFAAIMIGVAVIILLAPGVPLGGRVSMVLIHSLMVIILLTCFR